MPAGKLVENLAATIAHRQRAGHAACRKMFHQSEKERQIGGIDALFIDRQDEGAARRVHQIVGVLDAFGDPFEREQTSQRIAGDKAHKLVVADFGIDRHVSARRMELVLFERSARDPDFTRHVEDHALLERRDDVDRDIIAAAKRLDHFFDDNFRR